MQKETLSIKVAKSHGEKLIVLANKLALREREFEIQSDEKYVYMPVVREPSQEEKNLFKEKAPEFQLEVRVFKQRAHREKTLMEVLENQLPPHSQASLPKALDIVGDIAIVEVPPELKTHEKLLGEAILQTHKNVRTVLAKAGAVGGTYRLREFDVIAGEHKTNTLHKEFGCQYYVDVAKAYFSPRLSHEHQRVASLVQKGETVVDLFAGVGPFAVLIAKNNANVKVYALDINPEAVELLKRNVRLNRVENRVIPILGDARQIVEEKLLGVADRVIMNLPESAAEFVDVACNSLKPTGGVVHFYGFVRTPDSIEELENRFSKSVENSGRNVQEPISAKTVRETAPYEMQVVLDAKII